MSSSRVQAPPVNLKERIAALEQRNASTQRSVSPGPVVAVPPASTGGAFRDKIAHFEKKGGVPIPRSSFGLGAPPPSDGQPQRRGELYGNRIPQPTRVFSGNRAVQGTSRSKPSSPNASPNNKRRTVSVSNIPPFFENQDVTLAYPQSSRPTSPDALTSHDTIVAHSTFRTRSPSLTAAFEFTTREGSSVVPDTNEVNVENAVNDTSIDQRGSVEPVEVENTAPAIIVSAEENVSEHISDHTTSLPTVEEETAREDKDERQSLRDQEPKKMDDTITEPVQSKPISSSPVDQFPQAAHQPEDGSVDEKDVLASGLSGMPKEVVEVVSPHSTNPETTSPAHARVPPAHTPILLTAGLGSPLSDGVQPDECISDSTSSDGEISGIPPIYAVASPAGMSPSARSGVLAGVESPVKKAPPPPLSLDGVGMTFSSLPSIELAPSPPETEPANGDADTILVSRTESREWVDRSPSPTTPQAFRSPVPSAAIRRQPEPHNSPSPVTASASDLDSNTTHQSNPTTSTRLNTQEVEYHQPHSPPPPTPPEKDYGTLTISKTGFDQRVSRNTSSFKAVVHGKTREVSPIVDKGPLVPHTPQILKMRGLASNMPPASPGFNELVGLLQDTVLLEQTLEEKGLPAENPGGASIGNHRSQETIRKDDDLQIRRLSREEAEESKRTLARLQAKREEQAKSKLRSAFRDTLSRTKSAGAATASAYVESRASTSTLQRDSSNLPESQHAKQFKCPSVPHLLDSVDGHGAPLRTENPEHQMDHHKMPSSTSKSSRSRFPTFRRLGGSKTSGGNFGGPARQSTSTSSEISSEDSGPAVTPPDNSFEFGDLSNGPGAKQNNGGVSWPSVSPSKKGNNTILKAATFAGKVWQRARTKSGVSNLSTTSSLDQAMPESVPALPPLPQLIHSSFDSEEVKPVAPQETRSAQLSTPDHKSAKRNVSATPQTARSSFLHPETPLGPPNDGRPHSWLSVSSTGTLPSPLFDEDLYNAFPSVPQGHPHASPHSADYTQSHLQHSMMPSFDASLLSSAVHLPSASTHLSDQAPPSRSVPR